MVIEKLGSFVICCIEKINNNNYIVIKFLDGYDFRLNICSMICLLVVCYSKVNRVVF